MLVISRKPGESIVLGTATETCLLTVISIDVKLLSARLLVCRSRSQRPGNLDIRKTELLQNGTIHLSEDTSVTVIEIRDAGDAKVRLGIVAPRETSVHRFEVYELIVGHSDDRDEDWLSGSPVPRPGSPKPPSLDVRLDEPQPDEM